LLPKESLLGNIKFRIELAYEGGNNFYLDEVQVGLASSINNQIQNQQLSFEVLPNPFNEITKVKFILQQNEFIDLSLFDITGKQISNIFYGNQFPGNHEVEIDRAKLGLTNGIYFIKMRVGDSQLVQKIVVN
jgi:hypothetical protein